MKRGLSYTLVYNLAHGRIRTLSARDYKIIFGEDPPLQETERVDGEYFRGMVKLWLFLNNEVSEADLYREFYPHKKFRRVDYRIFTGDVKTVSMGVDKIMEQKFFDHGFDRDDIKASLRSVQWDIVEDAHGMSKVRIFGRDTHIVEGIMRALQLAKNSKNLNIWLSSIKV